MNLLPLTFNNLEQQTPLRRLLMLHALAGGKEVEDTATGNPLTFLTDLARPLKSLVASFTPIQSGSGDPSPTNVRSISGWSGVNVTHCGQNLLNYDLIADTNVGTDITGDRKAVAFTKAGKYYIKSLRTWSEAYLYARVKNADGTFGNIIYVVAGTNVTNKTVTITDGQTLIMFNASSGVNGTTEKTIERFDGWGIVVSFEDMTTYEAYTGNVYPATFPAVGKNLLDITQTDAVKPGATGSTITIENGVISIDAIAASSRTYVVFSQTFPAGTYTIQGKVSGSCNALRLLASVEFEGSSYNNYYGMYLKAINSTYGSMTFTLPSAAKIGVNLNNATGESGEPGSAYDIQLESGSSATTYEPYTSTIYGGSLDLATGVLTAEWALVSKKWSEFGSKFAMEDNTRGQVSIADKRSASGGQGALCNVAKRKWNYDEDSVHFYTDADYAVLTLPNGTDESTDVQIVYPLATPLTYQLTPQQITALIGDNTIWSDANGDCEVTYLKKG